MKELQEDSLLPQCLGWQSPWWLRVTTNKKTIIVHCTNKPLPILLELVIWKLTCFSLLTWKLWKNSWFVTNSNNMVEKLSYQMHAPGLLFQVLCMLTCWLWCRRVKTCCCLMYWHIWRSLQANLSEDHWDGGLTDACYRTYCTEWMVNTPLLHPILMEESCEKKNEKKVFDPLTDSTDFFLCH